MTLLDVTLQHVPPFVFHHYRRNREIARFDDVVESDDQRLEDNEQTRESVMRFLKRQRTIDKVIESARGLSDEEGPEKGD